VRGITAELAKIDPNLVPARVRPLDELMAHSRAAARFSMLLVTMFAGFSLLLACLGLYGVVAYSVAQRTAEFGIRAALGARASDLVALVVGQGLRLVAAGVAIGLVASLLLVNSIKSLLFGISAFDPITFIGVPLVLGGMALLACYVAARRAARIDPAHALRNP
jgi:ABC-type antimicrobial peptide transport system permease subunit